MSNRTRGSCQEFVQESRVCWAWLAGQEWRVCSPERSTDCRLQERIDRSVREWMDGWMRSKLTGSRAVAIHASHPVRRIRRCKEEKEKSSEQHTQMQHEEASNPIDCRQECVAKSEDSPAQSSCKAIHLSRHWWFPSQPDRYKKSEREALTHTNNGMIANLLSVYQSSLPENQKFVSKSQRENKRFAYCRAEQVWQRMPIDEHQEHSARNSQSEPKTIRIAVSIATIDRIMQPWKCEPCCHSLREREWKGCRLSVNQTINQAGKECIELNRLTSPRGVTSENLLAIVSHANKRRAARTPYHVRRNQQVKSTNAINEAYTCSPQGIAPL